jgi:hypothetical protein
LAKRKEAPTTHTKTGLLGGADDVICQKDKENVKFFIDSSLKGVDTYNVCRVL